jgi:hypothetical protein
MTHGTAFWFQAVWAVVVRPRLWPTALRQAVRMTRPRWWTRAPFLPIPDAAYLRFRLQTAYGLQGTPRASDLVRYLEWCRASEARIRRERRAA